MNMLSKNIALQSQTACEDKRRAATIDFIAKLYDYSKVVVNDVEANSEDIAVFSRNIQNGKAKIDTLGYTGATDTLYITTTT